MTVARTICSGFLGVITVGTLLLMLPISLADGSWNSWVTALFTATSATCVTGLIVVDTGSYYSFWGQLTILALIQVGGLGYMTANTFLLILLGRRSKVRYRIALQDSLDSAGLSSVSQLLKSIVGLTLLLELTGIFALMTLFVPEFGWTKGLWQSIFHSISAFNNAGFSLFEDSLMRYVNVFPVTIMITLLIILGGIGYQVMMEVFFWWQSRFKKNEKRFRFSLHVKVVTSTTALLLILGFLGFFASELYNPETLLPLSWGNKLQAAWFQSVTTRTAGFNTIDIGQMTTAGLFLTIALMFIGSSPGSTGGGIKTTTFRVLLTCTKSVLQGRENVVIYERRVPIELIMKAVGVAVGSIMIISASTMILAISEPNLQFINIFFETISAFATVGLSTGITSSFSTFGALVITVLMYAGRVGILILMAALLGDPKPSALEYPDEDLLVG
ncbi:TrkH family potassium uptake protein [Phormidium yuhuli AB48]|uniref:TrkH family potassium uptake protein n=1 Tax=Phormidium yuhuli AB48 TaxID=2940671 RepID=A0ABY5ANH5_9CYAN|nr:TrkH family potassium uptake protein [Phormidium yuhuli]USR90754.1 TrkH family potassium uptake protein [Phormidium yuhuli AB48]